MPAAKKKKRNLFVLDTNVLIHDPTALFRFEEHDIFLPMVVLEELDNNKKGHSEVAQNARQSSRFLAQLTEDASANAIKKGISLNQRLEMLNSDEFQQSVGKLFFQTEAPKQSLALNFPGHKNDNDILAITAALQKQTKYQKVILVSKDINLRIKASAIGVNIEDYHNDQALDDVNLLYRGHESYQADFWDSHSKDMHSWNEDGRTFYDIKGNIANTWQPNQFISVTEPGEFEVIVREPSKKGAIVERIHDYSQGKNNVWGINARNKEQNYALNLLMDPDVDFVSLVGQAGTGKTLLALAAGLAQTLDDKIYREIIMTRVTISVGEDIGFLPGTEEEKMTPWMGALMDNLEVLSPSNQNTGKPGASSDWGKQATNDVLKSKIQIRSLNFMRGRTFLERFLIIDEAQNLTSKQIKTLITRAGPGTKIVCLGNVAQIDTPYLTETTSGLTYVVDRFRSWSHSGHITLQRGERSRLADFAADSL